jgi:hypothetical protein
MQTDYPILPCDFAELIDIVIHVICNISVKEVNEEIIFETEA